MSANDDLFDAILRHQIYLLRYSGYVRNRMTAVLNATEEDIAMRIRDKLRNSKGLTAPVEWRRMQALIDSIASIRSEAWGKTSAFMLDEGVSLANQEPVFMRGAIGTASPVVLDMVLPTPRLLKAIALSQPFEGRILKEWASTMEADDLRRIGNAIKMGMVAGESSDVIAQRVVGTRALKGADGMTELTRRQINTITRTAVMHISNNARAAFLNENVDVIEAEQFVATLDSRTTPICRANDGKIFELNKGPRPPLHYSCRSLRIAALDGQRLGDRPAKPVTEKLLVKEFAEKNGYSATSRDALPRGTKGQYDDWARKRIRELVGPVPADTTYQEWMKKQSIDFQEDVLGKTKAKLFRDGGLPLDRFVNRNGDELTLAEMARRDAAAFRAAGLNPEAFE